MKIGGQVNQDSITGIEVQLNMKATWIFSLRSRRLKVKCARELKNSWRKGREPLNQRKFSIPSWAVRKRRKNFMGPSGSGVPFFACLPQTLRFSCTYITSKRLLHRLRHSVPASTKRGFIFPTIIVIMYCSIMLWYGGGSVCPEIKMTHHDSRGLLFSGGNSLPFCPLPYTLARLWTLTDCMTGLLGRCFL